MSEKRSYYIAYGSNLSEEQMAYRCPDARITGMNRPRRESCSFVILP